ncbi:MAG: tryptophan--tRNA ligase [Bacilli bacterium]
MKTMITGIQHTGNFTLGNYLGAIKNFVKLQDKYNSYIFIADLRGLTTYQEPKNIHDRILDLAAIYLACGVDPKKTNFFIQSDVLEHTELGFLIAFQCRVGELSRMTQYKSKKQKQGSNGIDLGLLIYPTLMAADILLYDAEIVPVGNDQIQHIEITRDIGERFNKRYKKTFKLPEYYVPEVGARIMNLQNPLEKMSKSSPIDDKGTIFILDDIEITKNKIMRSKTDSENKIYYDEENKPGISNLISIYSAITNKTIKKIEDMYKDKNYKEFKNDLANILEEFILPIQEKYKKYRYSKELLEILKKGKLKAQEYASKKITEVKRNLGIKYDEEI